MAATETPQCVEVRKKHEWRKETWSRQIRAMKVGDTLPVGIEYHLRQSRYVGAKLAFPGARFSVRKQDDGTFRIMRVA